jgi:hypothetical protein
MNRHPIELVMPLFHWLDWIIAEYGLYIYLVAVWVQSDPVLSHLLRYARPLAPGGGPSQFTVGATSDRSKQKVQLVSGSPVR